MNSIDRYFGVTASGSTFAREASGGATTFFTMCYIIFVQPAVLSAVGMDFGSVMTATCLSSAFATLLMGVLARYPIALGPAMGHNFFFVYTVVLTMGIKWEIALGAVFISGVLFIILSFLGFREKVVESVPDSLKQAIAAGIGLLIALVGLEWSGLVVAMPGTFIGLGELGSPPVLLTLFGLTVISSLMALKVRAAILIGIASSLVASLIFGMSSFDGIIAMPPSIAPTFLKLDIW
ncbi:MAG: NCS2 family permease, partial [Deltaproteobacteria bacterium]|nr:NCS2 family permease [Deltaproteobacteria bacterium]